MGDCQPYPVIEGESERSELALRVRGHGCSQIFGKISLQIYRKRVFRRFVTGIQRPGARPHRNEGGSGNLGIRSRRGIGIPAVEGVARRRENIPFFAVEQKCGKRIVIGHRRIVKPRRAVVLQSERSIVFDRAAARVQIDGDLVARPFRLQYEIAHGIVADTLHRAADRVMPRVDGILHRAFVTVDGNENPPHKGITRLLRQGKRDIRRRHRVRIHGIVQRCAQSVFYKALLQTVFDTVRFRRPFRGEYERSRRERGERNGRPVDTRRVLKKNARRTARGDTVLRDINVHARIFPAAENISPADEISVGRKRYLYARLNVKILVIFADPAAAHADDVFVCYGIDDGLPLRIDRGILSRDRVEIETFGKSAVRVPARESVSDAERNVGLFEHARAYGLALFGNVIHFIHGISENIIPIVSARVVIAFVLVGKGIINSLRAVRTAFAVEIKCAAVEHERQTESRFVGNGRVAAAFFGRGAILDLRAVLTVCGKIDRRAADKMF